MRESGHKLRQQTVLAKFGELALRSDDIDEILTEACRLVGDGLGTDVSKVMSLEHDGETLLVRAGIGWKPGVVGLLTVKAADDSSEGMALHTGEPMTSSNAATETRFHYPQFLIDNGVVATANVVIIGGRGKTPFGLLQVGNRKPRDFSKEDTAFLRSYANLVAAVVDRLRVIVELRDGENGFASLWRRANWAAGSLTFPAGREPVRRVPYRSLAAPGILRRGVTTLVSAICCHPTASCSAALFALRPIPQRICVVSAASAGQMIARLVGSK